MAAPVMQQTGVRTVQQQSPRAMPAGGQSPDAALLGAADGADDLPTGGELEQPKKKKAPDCAWCRYGKPAVAGAVAGAVLAHLLGYEAAKGGLYGAVAGLGYGQFGSQM